MHRLLFIFIVALFLFFDSSARIQAQDCPAGRVYSANKKDLVSLDSLNDYRFAPRCAAQGEFCHSQGRVVLITRIENQNLIRVEFENPQNNEKIFVKLEGIADLIEDHKRSAAMDLLEGLGGVAFFYESANACAAPESVLPEVPIVWGRLISLNGRDFSEELAQSGLIQIDHSQNCSSPGVQSCLDSLAQDGARLPSANKLTLEQRADLNYDGIINSFDLLLLRLFKHLGFYSVRGDIDADGEINGYDQFRLSEYLSGRLGLEVKRPIRRFFLDSRGRTFDDDLSDLQGKSKPILSDTKQNTSWYVRYQRMGHVRRHCRPPLLNISFDKDNALFNGMSSENPLGLKYQEVRFISDCDFLKFLRTPSFATFLPDVLMREYLITQFFREQGIPSLDVVEFAELASNAPQARFDTLAGGIFGSYVPHEYNRYLLVQRNDEQDDELPFSTQFELSPQILESTAVEELILSEGPEVNLGSRLGWRNEFVGPYFFISREKTYEYPLERISTLRYLLLSTFFDLGDHGPFHNQDYGEVLSSNGDPTGIWKILPYGMDISFTGVAPGTNLAPTLFRSSSPAVQHWLEMSGYLRDYFAVGKTIFEDKNTLYRLFLLIDRYPFPCDRPKLKAHLRKKFSCYAKYFKHSAKLKNLMREDTCQVTGHHGLGT